MKATVTEQAKSASVAFMVGTVWDQSRARFWAI